MVLANCISYLKCNLIILAHVFIHLIIFAKNGNDIIILDEFVVYVDGIKVLKEHFIH